jgi:glycosyltransferase involved in cell wall biosynthesis
VQSLELINTVKKKYGIKKDYLLYVGNFKPHKNVDCLVEAFIQLPSRLKEYYQLVLSGKLDEYSIRLVEKVKKLSLDGKVVFTGLVSDDDLPSLYSGATVFVFPSLYEGFGLPPLEAMACGTPVICSNKTSLPEVIGDGGVLVDPGRPEDFTNAIESLLSDQSVRDSISLKGLQRAREFSLGRTAKKLLETIEGIVNE